MIFFQSVESVQIFAACVMYKDSGSVSDILHTYFFEINETKFIYAINKFCNIDFVLRGSFLILLTINVSSFNK